MDGRGTDMRKIKKWIHSLRGRIIIYNLIMVIVVALLGSIVTYKTALDRSKKVIKQSMSQRIEGVSDKFQVAYEEMMNIVLNCTGRKSMNLGSLDFTQQPSQRKQALMNNELMSDYCAISGYGTYISKLMMADKEGHFIQTGSNVGSTDDFDKLMETSWFSQELVKETGDYKVSVVENPFFGGKGEDMIPIIRPLDNTGLMREEGWVFLGISAKLFEDELARVDSGNTMIAVTGMGAVIAKVETEEIKEKELALITDMLLKRTENSGVIEEKTSSGQWFISYAKSPETGILTYEMMPIKEALNERAIIIRLAGVLFFVCLLLGLLLSVLSSRRIRKPIDLLTAQVKKIGGGDFSRNPQLETDDEIGEIGKGINHMSGKIEQLLKKNVEDEREKKNLEIKMLQAQINPHFLYNTLDSIRWIAVIQKNASIVKMVTALSSLLKNMAKGFNEKVTLREELNFLQDYIIIEKMRYMEMFDVEIHVEEESLYNARIVKLTLQPLVENAIFSGIEPMGENGIISIHVKALENTLCISVRDNGVGIPEEKIEKILKGKEKSKNDTMSGIGLPNVDQRIKLVYGEEYGLSIESKVGEYTEIQVRIPIEY